MSNRTIKNLVLSMAAVAIVVLLAGCASSAVPSNVPPPAPALTDQTNQPDSGKIKPSATVTIKITDDGFVPQKITVKPNTEVVWVNEGTKAHNVTLLDTMRTSGSIAKHDKISHLFLNSGTYPYRDSFFSTHQGVVFVK